MIFPIVKPLGITEGRQGAAENQVPSVTGMKCRFKTSSHRLSVLRWDSSLSEGEENPGRPLR